MHCPRHVSGESRAGNRHRRMFCASGRKRKYILLKQKKQFYAFQWPFSRMFQWGRLEKEFTADGLTTWFRLYFSSFLWCLFFPSPSSCKIGVWLNTCKLCCDYQPLKSSFRNKNLYIVKSPRLLMSLFGPFVPVVAALLLRFAAPLLSEMTFNRCFWPSIHRLSRDQCSR